MRLSRARSRSLTTMFVNVLLATVFVVSGFTTTSNTFGQAGFFDNVFIGDVSRTPHLFFRKTDGNYDSVFADSLGLRFRVTGVEKLRIEEDADPIVLTRDGIGFLGFPFSIKGEFNGIKLRNSQGNSLIVANTAPEVSLLANENGIGIGTPQPEATLHVRGESPPQPYGYDDAKILVENDSSGAPEIREMFSLVNNGGARFSFTDTSNESKWFFSTDGSKRFNISLDQTGGPELVIGPDGRVMMGPGPVRNFDLRANGDLHLAGVLFESSDRNAKTAVKAVDANDILELISQLPISTWQYKSDHSSVRHMGPMAQDFREAFGLGESDTTIASLDTAGVSLAAIKALNDQSKKKDQTIRKLSDEVQSLHLRLRNLEAMVEALVSTPR